MLVVDVMNHQMKACNFRIQEDRARRSGRLPHRSRGHVPIHVQRVDELSPFPRVSDDVNLVQRALEFRPDLVFGRFPQSGS